MVRAVKIINKLSTSNENKLFKETDILKEIDHPNIVKVYEIFVDIKHYYIVTEYCEGSHDVKKITLSRRRTV